jgi:phosphate transport system substrate-binding protein
MIKNMIIGGLVASSMITMASARENIQIAGSSTVLPYAKIVSEEFAKAFPQFKSPVVESGGSSAGIKEFCKGAGLDTIDIANASRPIKDKEVKVCEENGVKDIIEVRFGYDGIVFATDASAPDFAITPKDMHSGLAAKVVVNGKIVDNPNKKWNTVNKSFPDWKIEAYIPGEKHGTREVFEEKLLLEGCKENGTYDAYIKSGMNEKDSAKACIAVRKDGAALDIDGDYTETLARIASNPQGIGVFGLSFYENNTDKLKVATINGVVPSVETISSGEYPVSRPLFFYVKKSHIGVIPGLMEYVEFFASDRMIGDEGPLADYGLVPAPVSEREALRASLK